MAEPVRVRRLTDQEGQKPQQIVRRGSTSSVRYRRAMMLLASAGGNRVPVIAQLVQADEDTVRDVIHRFNDIGLACLDPRWAGGCPRQLSPEDEDFVIQTAITRPAKLGQPFTRWSLRKLVTYLRKAHGRIIRIGREALRCLLARRGVTFQRTKTWKESPDPDREAKLDRIEEVLDRFPDRVFAFDEFGPLGIRPTAGSAGLCRSSPTGCPPPTNARTACATSTATAIERFGVFVALDDGPDHPVFPGVGFISFAELSWRHFDAASDVVQIGQRLSCEFLQFDTWNLEARLSLKATQPDPFQAFADAIAVGRKLPGQVTKLIPFGVFVQVADGIEGLVHLRELAWTPVETPSDVVQVGDKITVVVTEIDRERRRLALSRRQGSSADM